MAAEPSPADELRVSVIQDGREAKVVATGDLDVACAHVLADAVRQLWRNGTDEVVVDLGGVGFMDSAGLRTLLSLRNDAKRGRRRLTFLPAGRAVDRVFVLTRTRGLFDWRER